MKKLILLALLYLTLLGNAQNIITYFGHEANSFESKDKGTVEIVDFFCTDTMLVWVTSMEINTSHFEIEQSEDGIVWELYNIVPAKGTSSTPSLYTTKIDGTYVKLNYVDYDASIYPYAIAYCGELKFVESEEEKIFQERNK